MALSNSQPEIGTSVRWSQGAEFCHQASLEDDQSLTEAPANTFISACESPRSALSHTESGLLTYRNVEIINGYCFKLLSLWYFVTEE